MILSCTVSRISGLFAGLAKTPASELIATRYARACIMGKRIVKVERSSSVVLRVFCVIVQREVDMKQIV
jgi:hypothetical protein